MKFWSQMPIKENPSMEDVLMLGDTLDVNNPKTITLQQMMDIAGEKVSSVEVVEELPAEGRENKLYIKKISQDDTYVYESYIWDDNAYHQMSNGGGGSGDSVWEKDANNNIFPKGNINVSGTNNFVTGINSTANHKNSISIGNGNESKGNNSIVIGISVKDFDPSGDALGWSNLIAMGNNPVIPPQSLNIGYSTWEYPKLIIGGTWGFQRWNTLEQTINGDLYIKGINGWTGTNATPDGVSHLQGYLSGLNTRISNNTTAIGGKQNTLTAGNNIEIENDVISVPRDVTLENIQSPSDNTAINIDSNPGQTRDNIYITAWGNESDAQIQMYGAANGDEGASIDIYAAGYNDAQMQLMGGTEYAPAMVFVRSGGLNDAQIKLMGGSESNKNASINIDANGDAASTNIQMQGGDDDNPTQLNLNACGSSDSIIAMSGGTESDNKSSIMFTANGSTESAEIQMKGGDDNNSSYVNIDSQRFTHNSKEISVDPTLHHFSNNDSLILEDNSIYTAIEKISAFAIDDWGGTSVVSFDTATSGGITITLPQTIKFVETPTFGNNEHWEIAVRNGYAVYSKYDLV